MICARSPLFPLTYLLACIAGFFGALWQFAQGQIGLLGGVLLAFAGVLLVLIAVVEWRIYHGWEPIGLRRFYSGVTVVGKYRDDGDLPGHKRVEIQLQDGHRQSFILDPEEISLCKGGDLIHLWAIGKHVAHIVKIGPGDPPVGSWGQKEGAPDGCAVAVMWILPVVGSFCAGIGASHLLGHVGSVNMNLGLLIGGWAVAIVVGIVWIRGWRVARGAISEPVGGASKEAGGCLIELLLNFPFWWM